MADYTVSGVADIDTRKFVAGMTRLDKSIEGVKKNIGLLSRQIDRVSAKKIDIGAELNSHQVLGELGALDELLDSQDGRTIDIQIDVDVAGAVVELEMLDKLIDHIDGRKIDIDASAASASVAGLGSSAAGAASSIGGGRASLYAAIGLLGTALIPMGAVAAGWGAAVASAAVVAGAGMGTFIGFAVPGVLQLKNAMKQLQTAQAAVDNAKSLKARTAALVAQKKVIDSLPPSISLLIAKWTQFKSTMEELTKPFNPKLFSLMGKGIDILTIAMKALQPTALSVAGGLGYVADKAAAGLKGDSWTKFFDYLANNAAPILDNLLLAFGNLLTGVLNMVRGFDPLTQSFSQGFLGMSESFLNWSKSLDTNKSFQNFVTYVQTNGPVVWDAIKNISKSVWDLLKALEPIGMKVLAVVDAFTGWVSSNPKIAGIALAIMGIGVAIGPVIGLVSTVVGWFGKIIASPLGKVVGSLGKSFGWFGKILGGLGLSGASSAFGGLGGAISLLSGPVGWIIGALTLLGIGLALTDRNGKQATGMWASLGAAWDAIKSTGAFIVGVFQQVWGILQNLGVIQNFQAGISSLADAFVSLQPVIKAAAVVLGVVLGAAMLGISLSFRALGAVVQWLAALIGGAVNVIIKIFTWLYDVLVGHSIIPDLINAIKDWFGKILGFITAPLTAVLAFVVGVWNAIKSASAAVWAAIKAVVGAGVKFVVNVIKNDIAAVKGIISAVWNTVKTLFSSAWSALKRIVSTGVKNVVTVVKTVKEKITGVFSDIKGKMSEIGGWVIDGVVNGIKGAVGRVVGAATSIVDHLTGPVKKLLGIGSPSKVFADFGRWVNEGLIIGLTGTQSKVVSTVEKMAKEIQAVYLAAWNSKDHAKGATDAPAITAATKVINSMRKQTDALKKNAADREAVAAKIKEANKALEDAIKLRDDFASKVSDDAIALGSVVANFTSGSDSEAATSAQDIISQLQSAISATDAFASNLDQLKNMGLDQTSIEQLINAGVATGGQVAKALVEGGGEAVAQIVKLQSQLKDSAEKLGTTSAKYMYQAGVDAATGLLNGLKSQEAALINQANAIATKIANTLKKALQVHSPSRVTYAIGDNVVQGLVNAIADGESSLNGAMQSIASTISTFKFPKIGGDFSSNVNAVVQGGAVQISSAEAMKSLASSAASAKNAQGYSEGDVALLEKLDALIDVLVSTREDMKRRDNDAIRRTRQGATR